MNKIHKITLDKGSNSMNMNIINNYKYLFETKGGEIANTKSKDKSNQIQSIIESTKKLFYSHDLGNNRFQPLYWRKELVPVKLGEIDALHNDSINYGKVCEIFSLFGMIDLNLRDAPGLGHARILLRDSNKFKDILKNVINAIDYCGIAITEEGAGTDLHNLESVAIPNNNNYVLNGKKCFVARIEEATYFIVFAYVIRKNYYKSLTAFLVEKDNPNIIYEQMKCSGFKGVSWGKIEFKNVVLDRKFRIGGEGEGFQLFAEHFSYWRTVQSSAALGSAYYAFSIAIKYIKDRNCFGGPIARFSHLQQELAYHFSRIKMCSLLISDIAKSMDKKKTQYYEACMLKAETIEIAIEIIMWSMKVHGARGCKEELLLEKRLQDVLALRIADGVTDVLRGQVAKNIVGKEIYKQSLNIN